VEVQAAIVDDENFFFGEVLAVDHVIHDIVIASAFRGHRVRGISVDRGVDGLEERS
jgi:hypothetical protein